MTRKLAFSSIMTALTVICLCGSVFFPTGKLALFAITSFCVLVTQAECGTKYALIQFLASGLIGSLLVPFKSQIVIFILFIGYYPIVKSYIEHIGKLWTEWLVKIMFFNAVLIAAYFALKYFLLAYINFGTIFNIIFSHLLAVVTVSEIVFVLYDCILSMFASYYINVVQKRLKNINK